MESKSTEVNSWRIDAKFIGLLFWSLSPCPVVWFGLYVIKSAAWTFALYHCICLLPAILLFRSSWQSSFLIPRAKETIFLLLAALLFSSLALLTYETVGQKLLCDKDVIELLKSLDYSKQAFWPLSIYTMVVNPFFEELFWRGVLYKELDRARVPVKHFAIVWSSISYALFHYSIFRLVLFPFWAELGTFLLAIYGAILACVFKRSGSIALTVLAHALLTDTAVILLLLALFRRFPGFLF